MVGGILYLLMKKLLALGVSIFLLVGLESCSVEQKEIVKGFEYHTDYVEELIPRFRFHWDGPDAEHAQLFFWLYFVLTGLHALHVTIGVGILTVVAILSWRGRITAESYVTAEITGLYWHFVDIVWVFLFPLLYLIGHR